MVPDAPRKQLFEVLWVRRVIRTGLPCVQIACSFSLLASRSGAENTKHQRASDLIDNRHRYARNEKAISFSLTTILLCNIIVVYFGATRMGSRKIATKIVELIRQHFPWGHGDCPPHPADDDPSVIEKLATGWINNRVRSTRLADAALALHARIQAVVEEMQDRLPPTERSRFSTDRT